MSGYENRFAEVQRRSREARAKLYAAQEARAVADERKADAIREQREQPDPAYSEWDSAPPATPARKLAPKSGSEPGSKPESNPETGHEKE
jgi:hypothetical protein